MRRVHDTATGMMTYATSFGGNSLPPAFATEFSELDRQIAQSCKDGESTLHRWIGTARRALRAILRRGSEAGERPVMFHTIESATATAGASVNNRAFLSERNRGRRVVGLVLACSLITLFSAGCDLLSTSKNPVVVQCDCCDCDGQLREAFNNTNTSEVYNNGTAPGFSLSRSACLRKLYTYHWNFGHGTIPGTIGLRDASGTMYGPFQATASAGQGGAPNVNWEAVPGSRVVLQPGTYTVVDSDPTSWSQNSTSGGKGFSIITVQEH